MKLNKKGLNAVLLGAVSAGLLVACGDGGGSDGGAVSTVTYTGLTSQAAIDEASAPVIAESVVSTDTSGIPTFVGVSGGADDVSTVDNLKSIADVAKKLATTTPSPAADTVAGAVASDSFTIQGCQGTATFSGTYDDYYEDIDWDPIVYNLSVSFNNYVDDVYGDGYYCGDVIFNGTMAITSVYYDGPIDQYPEVSGMDVALGDLSVTEIATGLNQAFNGALVLRTDTITGGSSISMTADFRDTDGLVYRAENYTLTSDVYDNLTSISGRLYNPAYGYIDLTTTTPFGYGYYCYDPYTYELVPDTGVLRIDGANNGYIVIDANTGACDTYTLTWSADGTSTVAVTKNWY